jgi:thioredoxin 1
MKSGCRKKIIVFLLGLLLLAFILPAWAQAPGLPQTLPQLYEFDRKLCPVCRKSEVIIQEVRNLYPGQFAGHRLYIDEHEKMFRQYRVAIVPTQVFLDSAGKEVFRHEGVFPKDQLIQKLRELKFIRDGKK